MKTRKIHTTAPTPIDVRSGLSRGRSSRLWNAWSPVSRRSIHGQK